MDRVSWLVVLRGESYGMEDYEFAELAGNTHRGDWFVEELPGGRDGDIHGYYEILPPMMAILAWLRERDIEGEVFLREIRTSSFTL